MNDKTFKRGVHPATNKKQTETAALQDLSTPGEIYISLSQHIGAPANPVVEVGGKVKAGTLIGQAGGFVSANVYSSVSGTVKGFAKRPTATGSLANHVIIENDGLYEAEFLPVMENPSKQDIVARIKEAGIVGMGGATFPTHVKYSPQMIVDTLIINGAECEPYITCDYRIMLEKAALFLSGVRLLKKALGVNKAYIGVENNKPAAIEKLKAEIGTADDVEVVTLKAKYPQGAEKQLIYAVKRRKVPAGKLPMDIGVVVSNVQTAFAVYEAVNEGKPSYMRAMTVAGDGVEKEGNYWVRTGVTYQHIYDELRGDVDEDKTEKVISGGPMMGFAQANLKPAVTKGTSSVLFLSGDQIEKGRMTQCINCARCAKGCPMNLMPMEFERFTEEKNFEMVKKLGVLNCIECGACTFNCPAKRPLIQAIRLSKKTIREKGI